MLPILRQMHEADARGQAALLLIMPQAIILKHAEVLKAATARTGLHAASAYVDAWVAAMQATRSQTGAWREGPYAAVKIATAPLVAIAQPPAPPPSIEI